MEAPAIELEDVTRRFGAVTAVDSLTLRVEKGAFLGLLGRNGAGKTTTINMTTGLLPPSGGRIRVLGIDVAARPLEVKRRIGVMPQEESLFGFLTGMQFLLFVGRVHGLADAEIRRRAGDLFEVLDLAPAPGTLLVDYSYGMKKKVGLAAALVHVPEVLFLDEPFEGIDPATARTIRELLASLRRRGVTILMSSHVLPVVEKLCDPIAIIEKGRLAAHGSLGELRERHDSADGLEELFVSLTGGARKGELDWL